MKAYDILLLCDRLTDGVPAPLAGHGSLVEAGVELWNYPFAKRLSAVVGVSVPTVESWARGHSVPSPALEGYVRGAIKSYVLQKATLSFWRISVGGGYGDLLYFGTEDDAEAFRCYKAGWEQAPASKRLTRSLDVDQIAPLELWAGQRKQGRVPKGFSREQGEAIKLWASNHREVKDP